MENLLKVDNVFAESGQCPGSFAKFLESTGMCV